MKPALPRAAASLLQPLHDSYELCAYCPKMCRFACPVAEADAREALTPWAKMSAPFLLLQGSGLGTSAGSRADEADSASAGAPLEVAFETSWGCTNCGHCRDYCLHGNDVPMGLAAVRAAAIEAGVDSPVTDEVGAAFTRGGNAAGVDLGALFRKQTPSMLEAPSSAPLFLPGCGTSAGCARATLNVLERLGEEAMAFDPEGGCCGASLYWAGLPARFDAHARAFARRVRRRPTLIVADAGCAWALKVLYPRRGIRLLPEVVHLSQLLARLFREKVLKVKARVPGRFLYHDPCTLARELAVTEEPRAVLAAILAEPAGELSWNRRDASCCGGGALLPLSMPATSRRMALARAEEAKEKGATIVTSCPTCLASFEGAGVDAVDLAALVAKAL